MGKSELDHEREQALARLKCAHCQSLMNCESLAQAIVAELQTRFKIEYRTNDKTSGVSESELNAAVKAGISRFFVDLDRAA